MNDITIAPTTNTNPPCAAIDPERWVTEHGDYLFNYACGQLRDPCAAEDAVQDTLLAALRSQDRFAHRSTERTWLVSILRHKIYDQLRKRCRCREVTLDADRETGEAVDIEESMLWVHEMAAESMLPSRRIELDEFREELTRALGMLPPRLAQVFELYEMEEASGGEVCERMGISPENLWVMLHRARKQLRQQLEGWWSATQQTVSTN